MGKYICTWSSDKHTRLISTPIPPEYITSMDKTAQLAVVETRPDFVPSEEMGLIPWTEGREAILDRDHLLVLNVEVESKVHLVDTDITIKATLLTPTGEVAPVTDSFIVPIYSDRPTELRTANFVDGVATIVFQLHDTGYYTLDEAGVNSELADDGLYIIFDGVRLAVSK